MTKRVVLKVREISKSFPGTKALSKVNLELLYGEVHALVGENGAGKSTLMNIISGVLPPDEGKIFLDDREVKFNSPKEAQDAGIGFVHQEIALCPHITVAENIFIGRLMHNNLGLINYRELWKRTEEVLRLFNSKIRPQQITRELTVSEQQTVEIAKSLSLNCKILILDEPTSSLTEQETEALFKIIEDLKLQGISVLYISHRMDEIFRICDRATVLRDGLYIDTLNVKETKPQEIINKMVGRNLSNLYPPKAKQTEGTIMEVKNFNRRGFFKNINFDLRKGEILGVAGLVGAGRTQVARAICGIDQADSGEVYLEGKKLVLNSYADAINSGIVYLTEDRKNEGLFLGLSVQENITAASLKPVSKYLLIKKDQEKELSLNFVAKLNIKIAHVRQKVNNLSGGNQQKVVIAKWLSVKPKIIFMDEPTRGIDVGAKSEIHNILRKLSNEGVGVIIISSELPELIGMCDRVLVMQEGALRGVLVGEDINEKSIITLASGQ